MTEYKCIHCGNWVKCPNCGSSGIHRIWSRTELVDKNGNPLGNYSDLLGYDKVTTGCHVCKHEEVIHPGYIGKAVK